MSAKTGFILGGICIIIALAAFAYRNRPATAVRLYPPANSPTPRQAEVQEVVESSPSPAASDSATEHYVLDSLNAGQPGKLTERMREQLTVVIPGTDCCGVITRAQTTPHFAILASAAAPWTTEAAAEIRALLRSQPSFAEDARLFQSANGYIVAVRVDSDNLIEYLAIIDPRLFQREPQQPL